MKKIMSLATALVVAASSVSGVSAGFKTIECSTDPIFSANSCNQCFSGWAYSEGGNLGFLEDKWINQTSEAQIMYKGDEMMPNMISLNGATWTQEPSAENFWQYSEKLNEFYDDEYEGYVLPAGKEVVWMESKIGSSYKLTKNSAAAGENIGLLVFPLTVTSEESVETVSHNECVLFTSEKAQAAAVPAKDTTPAPKNAEKLPETGPAEYIILLVLALLLGFGFMQVRKNS